MKKEHFHELLTKVKQVRAIQKGDTERHRRVRGLFKKVSETCGCEAEDEHADDDAAKTDSTGHGTLEAADLSVAHLKKGLGSAPADPSQSQRP